ncbi:MAG: YcaO-like family protein [Pseudomonadota bacterium]
MTTISPVADREYAQGTQRICDPEVTLLKITPILAQCGITRVLDITQLDRIGIPTYNAIRPNGIILSISNGKGWTNAAAAVSAIMESIEVEHSEYPLTSDWHLATSAEALRQEGHEPIDPTTLIQDCLWPNDEYGGLYYSPELILDWVEADELIDANKVMIPASTIYVTPPYLQYFTSNGLASGNSYEEAVLHAICEIVERDAIAKLMGRTKDSPPSLLRPLRLETLPGHLVDLAELVSSGGIEMFLLSMPSTIDIYTFWTIFYCPGEPTFILNTSGGYGTHTDPTIAASRALTEAAQARLAHIHGAREDLGIDHVNRQLSADELAQRTSLQARTFDKFRTMPSWSWEEMLEAYPHHCKNLDIQGSLDRVLDMLVEAGMGKVFVHDLTKPNLDVAVTRVFIPGMKISANML